MATTTKKVLPKAAATNPEYQWQQDDKILIKGADYQDILNGLRILLQAEYTDIVSIDKAIALFKASQAVEKSFIENVTSGLIKEKAE